jgi:hypothetical protein
VRLAVEPIQAVEAEKVKAKVLDFGKRVEVTRKAASKKPYLSYSSGPSLAFQSINEVWSHPPFPSLALAAPL